MHIATTLFNPSDDTVRFITMTCSYEEMFLTNTAVFVVQDRYCDHNFPKVYGIPPHSKLDQYIMIRPTRKEIKPGEMKLKIGMYYAVPKPGDGFQEIIDLYENRQKANVLWSNQLDLSRLYRKVYQ